jgi:hypothetical protein
MKIKKYNFFLLFLLLQNCIILGKIPSQERRDTSAKIQVYEVFDINYKVNGKPISISDKEIKLYFKSLEQGLEFGNVNRSTDKKNADILEISIQVEENWSYPMRYLSLITLGILPHSSRINYNCEFVWINNYNVKRKKIKTNFEVRGFYHLLLVPYLLLQSPIKTVEDNLTQVGRAVALDMLSELRN